MDWNDPLWHAENNRQYTNCAAYAAPDEPAPSAFDTQEGGDHYKK